LPNFTNAYIAGDSFSYQVTAIHKKDLPISFALINPPPGMTIDPNSGQIDWVVVSNPDGVVSFTIKAFDNATPQASATWDMGFTVCDAGMHWDENYGMCQGPVVIEPQALFGVDAGATFSYQVVASVPGGGAISYSLADAPQGMTIDDKGLISWQAAIDPNIGNYFAYTVIASNAQGLRTLQFDAGTICEAPTHWDKDAGACL
jgi:hypothetical protein